MARDMSVRLTRDPQAAASARRALEPLSSELSPSVLEDVRLLVSELVTNSVRHGGEAAENSVELDVTIARGAVRVEVTDRGRGFDPATPARPADATSGWGLVLVERLADRWGVDSKAPTRVWFELDAGQATRREGRVTRSLATGPGTSAARARGGCHYVVRIPGTV
jgi:anti-sigma regulatory factor (Ser/Thr protein kinase)